MICARRTTCCGVECRRSRAWRAWDCSSVRSTASGLGPRTISFAGKRSGMRCLGKLHRYYTAGSIPPGCTSAVSKVILCECPDRLLTADEVVEQVCTYFCCEQLEHLAQQLGGICTRPRPSPRRAHQL